MILKNPDGSETYYVELGDTDYTQASQRTAKTLLLLHGIGADHAMWQPQMRTYAEAGFHLLVPDLFGHGRSSKFSHFKLSDWHRQINWLLAHHEVENCTLIGASMGGVIAQSFVVEYPHVVEKLIISDSFGELYTFKEKLLGVSQIIGFSLAKILGKQFLAKGVCSIYQASYAQAAQDYFRQVSLKVDLNQMIRVRRAINRIDVLEQLQDIVIPALVIVGADLGQSFITINQKIADALPNAEFVILERAMDPSNLVNPVEFDQQVFRFFNRTLA
ncbi:MAG: alpha/beta hydrolase [Leptolyngbyaceae cyanobacterium MO_188.B28]|nr:alpha/beta hydrolase [Leptolyngbyaceae cyanobacterium MO_188.B28]